jgi:hypothetical protein
MNLLLMRDLEIKELLIEKPPDKMSGVPTQIEAPTE